MEREKLNEAYSQFIRDNRTLIGNNAPLIADTFDACADAIMSMPLSERLTEEEKKTLRELYTCYKQHEAVSKGKGLYEAEMIARGSTATMRDIFGKEMFENLK